MVSSGVDPARSATPSLAKLALTDAEAELVTTALGITVSLCWNRSSPARARRSTRAAIPDLVQIGRRLDHEVRHKGAVPNPNGPKEEASC